MSSTKRVRFNVIDFFIIICLIVACCFFTYYAVKHVKQNAASKNSILYYSLEMKDLSSSTADLFVVGDNISNSQTSLPAGTITEVKKSAHTYVAENSTNDEYVLEKDDTRFDVVITVKTNYSQNESSFVIGGEVFKVGYSMKFFTDRVSFDGMVCDIAPEN